MKRKIKFRVWDNLKMEYVESVQIDSHGCLLKITDDGRFDLEANDLEFVAEPFTGLLDKNGKEIYEGDIVKIRSHKGLDTGVIEYNSQACAYWITWKFMGQFRFLELTATYHDGDIYKNNSIGIIGNIHQTPELLTP